MNARTVPIAAALATLAAHAIGNPHYGFFRDELYFIICGFHPAWGYVDQPPVVPLLAAGSQLLGHSLFLLRLVPAIFAAAGVYVTCLLVVELGGGAFAQLIAALAYFFAGVLMSFGMKVGPDMIGLMLWPLCALYVLRIAKGGDSRLWLAAGAALGFSLESKYSVAFFAFALLAGLALTPHRRILASPWFFAGMALAAAIALPNFLWQAAYGFPMFELLRNGQNGKNVVPSPGLYLFQQLLLTNLFLSPIWIVGLVTLLRNGAARFLGYAYVILIASDDRFSRKALLSGRRLSDRHCGRRRDDRGLDAAMGGRARRARRGDDSRPAFSSCRSRCRSCPSKRWSATHGGSEACCTSAKARWRPSTINRQRCPRIGPTCTAGRNSPPRSRRSTTRCRRISAPKPRSSRATTAKPPPSIFSERPYGLPPAISGHNNYWLWGTHGYSGNVIIDVHGDCGASEHLFRTSRLAGRFDAPWVISYEHDIPIMVCTGLKIPLTTLWPKLRNYI